jgi:hypothetical protein
VVLANGSKKCEVCDFGGPTERVHLIGVSISFEKNFYRLPFTPPLWSPNQSFTKETNKRSMSSTKPLRELEHMDWVPIDYGEVFEKRRPFPNQNVMEKALEVDFPPEKKVEDSYDLESTGEIFQKLFRVDEVDLEHIAEVKKIMGIKPEASPYARLAEVYAIGSE